MQSPLLCDSDQAISRGIQWNKLLELLDRKGFEKSKAKFRGTPGTCNTCFFLNAVSDILYVLDTSPDTQLSNMTTKAFYSILINKPRNVNDNPETPKIFTDNIMPNPKVSLSYLTSHILSPPIKEHLFSPSTISF